MGYCPQFDALHAKLTARETLEFYGAKLRLLIQISLGRIRGIPESSLRTMVDYLINRYTRSLWQDLCSDSHSPTMQTEKQASTAVETSARYQLRYVVNSSQLSVAIALIGNPPIVFLDEPSTGE